MNRGQNCWLGRVLALGLTLGVTGCGSRVDMVNRQMEQITNQPAIPIAPAPVFLPVPSYTYSAQQMRSPFNSESALNPARAPKIVSKVYPDTSRPLQYLEQYPLDSLQMRGTIGHEKGSLYALVQDPTGGIMRVSPGMYMGKDYGRIIRITPSQINVIEIVPDGQAGYIERPRAVVMSESAG